MEKRLLGNSGLWVSRLCFGTITLSPLQANLTQAETTRLLFHAMGRGIDVMDTAEYYRNYPQLRSSSLHHMRLITKCHAFDRQGAKRSLERALEQTGRDSIDVMMLHEQESEWTLRGHAEALAYFYEQRTAGHIKAVGVSTHYIACAAAAAQMEGIDVIEAICNGQGLGIVDGTQEEMNRVLAAAHSNGKGVIAMKALGGGHLIHDAEAALRTVLSWPFVDSVAVGMQSVEEIDYNVLIASGQAVSCQLPAPRFHKPRRLHIAQWCTGCGRCSERCQQGALTLRGGKMHVHAQKCVLCGYCAAACKEFCIKVY